MRTIFTLGGFVVLGAISGCPGGAEDAHDGVQCGAQECGATQACCIDCNHAETCLDPGGVCGAACLADGGTDAGPDASNELECGTETCGRGEVCCIACDDSATCIAAGSACPLVSCDDDGDDASCVVDCAPLEPGCSYVGEVTCDPPSCPQIVCADAGPTVRTLSSLDDVCFTDGFTAQAILDKVEGSYTTTLLTFDPESVTYGEPSTGLTIEVAYMDGELLCYPPLSACAECGARDVNEEITLEAEIRLVTDDNRFNEMFTALFRVERAIGEDPIPADTMPSFVASIPTRDLVGSYAPVYDVDEEGTALEINGSFGAGVARGFISEVLRQTGPPTRVELTNVASWGLSD